jgi:arsenate reductase (thioredoxin)
LTKARYGACVSASTQRVLFICWHNSARSQMAEGFLRAFGGDRFEACSAGIKTAPVRPEAIEAMREIGIDISRQHSKTLELYGDQPFDWLITVCDDAYQSCPAFPGVERTLHWSIEDPAKVEGNEQERMRAFRRARDDLRGRIRMFLITASRDDLAPPTATALGGQAEPGT